MSGPTSEQIAGKLLVGAIDAKGPPATAVNDPIADTPMVLTLDQLESYDNDPRVTRNPRYDDIKSSILQRNLDAPPPVTRRPGAPKYTIRNGGNTRLKILRELWTETKDKRFFEIKCLFRPWSARGEIVLLTGHLAENELRGNLTFIERALGVAKAGEMYETEVGSTPLSQSELARRLTADGYPISQSQISRMHDTVRYLLPAIPQILYSGLGRPQIERLATFRKQAARVWDERSGAARVNIDFANLFQDVLATFDSNPDAFTLQRAQDELLGQMAEILSVDYDTLALEVAESDLRKIVSDPGRIKGGGLPLTPDRPEAPLLGATPKATQSSNPTPATQLPRSRDATRVTADSNVIGSPDAKTPSAPKPAVDLAVPAVDESRISRNIVSPVHETDRLRDIKQSIAAATGDTLSDFRSNVLRAIPVQAGGLHPISDIWYIEAGLDSQERLRIHIAQLAQEIAQEFDAADSIDTQEDGFGFCVRELTTKRPLSDARIQSALSLLSALSTFQTTLAPRRGNLATQRLGDDLSRLLLGKSDKRDPDLSVRLSDAAIVKLFRLIRLSRRIVELQQSQVDHTN
jgi:ParB family protein of integrating conjugative element (PFGI_1 class)